MLIFFLPEDYTNYVMLFVSLFIGAALFVMIGYYTFFPKKEEEIVMTTEEIVSEVYNYSAYGMCQEWIKKGDGFCDDEANVELCDFDDGDCCDLEFDRTLCTECFCYAQIDTMKQIVKSENTNESTNKFAHLKPISDHKNFVLPILEELSAIGDGICDMDLNKVYYFFDAGDCCKENVTKNELIMGHNFAKPCPECTCIPSFGYAYCIDAHLGDGICQDYNNFPFCEFDKGDCCDMSAENCCQIECELCECKNQSLDHYINLRCFWPNGPDGQDTTCGENNNIGF